MSVLGDGWARFWKWRRDLRHRTRQLRAVASHSRYEIHYWNTYNQTHIGYVIDWLEAHSDEDELNRRAVRRIDLGEKRIVRCAALFLGLIPGKDLPENRTDFDTITPYYGHQDYSHYDNYGPMYHYMIVGYMTDDEIAGARETYERLHERNPECLSALLNLGELERQRGNRERAVELCEAARGIAERPGGTQYRGRGENHHWKGLPEALLALVEPTDGPEVKELLALAKRDARTELVRRLYDNQALNVPAHAAVALSQPAERILIRAALSMSRFEPCFVPPSFGGIEEVELAQKLSNDLYEQKRAQDHLMDGLSHCAPLLRKAGENFWSAKMEEVMARGPGFSRADAEEILGWFGGVGSLDDLILSAIHGHHVSPEEEPQLNNWLSVLRASIVEEATKLRR